MSHQTDLFQSLQKGSGAYSTVIAAFSFLTGTSLFFLYKTTGQNDILPIGLVFVMLAFLVNAGVVLHLLLIFATQPQLREITVIRILILLSNLPVAYFFLYNL